jgi:parallel beta-helix repeat protein
MKFRRMITMGTVALSLAAATALLSHAGPINPPTGPVAPTMKTLNQVEPRIPIGPESVSRNGVLVISQSGSYFLTGNITANTGLNGIEIQTDNVSIDLRGYAVIGGAGSLDGITLTQAGLNVTVFNGIVRNFTGVGVNLGNASGSFIRDVQVAGNGGSGLRLGQGRIQNCSAKNNTGNGFQAFGNVALSGCTSEQNGAAGFSAGAGCAMDGCTASLNATTGFNVGVGNTLNNCTARSNTGNGFTASNGCVFRGCAASANGADGISTNTNGVISECSAEANVGRGLVVLGAGTISNSSSRLNTQHGIFAADGSTVVNCGVIGNSINGINAALRCTVDRCSAFANGHDGINAQGGSTVRNCTCTNSSHDGIGVSDNCYVQDNTVDSNGTGGGAGIRVTASGSRVEGNHATRNPVGFQIEGSLNTVFRNSAHGNTSNNYNIGGGNDAGAVVTAAAGASAWANIAF